MAEFELNRERAFYLRLVDEHLSDEELRSFAHATHVAKTTVVDPAPVVEEPVVEPAPEPTPEPAPAPVEEPAP